MLLLRTLLAHPSIAIAQNTLSSTFNCYWSEHCQLSLQLLLLRTLSAQPSIALAQNTLSSAFNCHCSEHSQPSLQVTLTGNAVCNEPVCSHLIHFVLPKVSAFHKPECYLSCRRLFYCYICISGTKPALYTANALCPPYLITTYSFVHQCLPTVFCVHRQPVSCCACPQCSVSTCSLYPAVPVHSVLCPKAACILLCLPTVFCVHRQPVSCALCGTDSPRNCCVH